MSVLRVIMPSQASSLDDRLDQLGATRVRLELPLGRILWLDDSGTVVAHARCLPLYAWSPSRRVLHPSRALPSLGATPPDGDRDEPTVRRDVDGASAMDFAQRRARELRLSSAVPVATPGDRHLFVGVDSLCVGAPFGAPDSGDEDDQAEQLLAWAREVLGLLVRSLADGEPDTARSALGAFHDALTAAIDAVRHQPVAVELATLRSNVAGWQGQLDLDQLAVAIRARREELRWGDEDAGDQR
jgi:hypothetical protein